VFIEHAIVRLDIVPLWQKPDLVIRATFEQAMAIEKASWNAARAA
jgi:hypothetical protein